MVIPVPELALSDIAGVDAVLFGKLPAHGDFVARGLSAREQDLWDQGLSRALGSARALWGETFEERYARAPPWRYLLRANHTWLAGALAPSLDRAGRLFPIMIGVRGYMPDQGPGFAAGCEDLLYQAIAARWKADELHERATRLPALAAVAPVDEGWWLDGAAALADPPATLPGFLPADLLIAIIAVTEQLS